MSEAIEKSKWRFLTLISTPLNLTVRNDQQGRLLLNKKCHFEWFTEGKLY